MSWAESLVKLASFEVETVQKRVAEIAARRTQAEVRLGVLTAEGEAETAQAGRDAASGMQLTAYLDGLRARKAQVRAEIETILIEEHGARDALAQAFEVQKKYEHVVEQARLLAAKETGRRETAVLDELGLRRAAR